MPATTQTMVLNHNDVRPRGPLFDKAEQERKFATVPPREHNSLRRRPIRDFLARCVHAFLYHLIHLIFSVVFTTRVVFDKIIHRVLALAYHNHQTPSMIQSDVKKLARLPRHLSIVLDATAAVHDRRAMSELIDNVCECAAWAACAGIQVLSIYERNGILKSAQPQLHQYISRTLTTYFGNNAPEKPTVSLRAPLMPAFSPPSTSPSTSPDPDASGRPSRHLSVIMLSEADGRRTLVDLAKTLAEMSQKRKISPQDISTELIDAEISESVMEEPDLVIVFGGTDLVLHGYPPWQIRLSEIYHVPGYCGVKYHSFLRGLQKYAGAQFRFGT